MIIFNPLLIPDNPTEISKHGKTEIYIIADHFASGVECHVSAQEKGDRKLVEFQRLIYDHKSWKEQANPVDLIAAT